MMTGVEKSIQERKAYVISQFECLFGGSPEIWGRAPGRVDLMGSHTDYNMGYVLTMTLDRDTWMAARPRSDGRVSIASLNLDGGCTFSLDAIQPDSRVPWTNYVRGVLNVLGEAGYPLRGFD